MLHGKVCCAVCIQSVERQWCWNREKSEFRSWTTVGTKVALPLYVLQRGQCFSGSPQCFAETERWLSKIVPKYLYYSTTSTGFPRMVVVMASASCLCLLENVTITSLVFVEFSWGQAPSHQVIKSWRTELWWRFGVESRDSRTVSSTNLTRWQFGWVDLQSSV